MPWALVPGNPDTYRVPNLNALQESFIFAGTHEEIVAERNEFSLKFVLGGEQLVAQQKQLTTMAGDLLDYYISLMGGVPNPAPGLELSQCMVIITQNNAVDGEVIGNHISMFMNPEGDPQSQMIGWFIFAHEFFHLWNGKSIKFEGSRSDWFKEGVSNYYTLKGLRKVGFINDDAFKAVLNNLFYQRYTTDPGFGEKSPVASAAGFSKDQHWGLIYGGGLFAGIAADMEIRKGSDNSRSLDDLMKELYALNGGTSKYLTNEDLIAKITAYGFEGFPEFFQNHLSGTEPISLAPFLKHAGAQVSENEGQLLIELRENRTALERSVWEGFLGG